MESYQQSINTTLEEVKKVVEQAKLMSDYAEFCKRPIETKKWIWINSTYYDSPKQQLNDGISFELDRNISGSVMIYSSIELEAG